MAKQTKTDYLCDSCGKSFARKELRQYRIEARKYGAYVDAGTPWIDQCDDCEQTLMVSLAAAGVAGDDIANLRRDT